MLHDHTYYAVYQRCIGYCFTCPPAQVIIIASVFIPLHYFFVIEISQDYPWKPKPVNLLTGLNAGVINENAAVVWFTGKFTMAIKQFQLLPLTIC